MNQSQKSLTEISAYTFYGLFGLTIFVYLLRGFGILTFIPGLVIWLLLVASIASGIFYVIMRNKRY